MTKRVLLSPQRWHVLIELIEFHEFITIPHRIKEFNKILLTNDYRPRVVIGMETQAGRVLEVLVNEEVDVVFCVVDEAEGGDAEKSEKNALSHP